MKVLGVIPARGGSKRVKGKNILPINGKPLIGYTIEDAMSSQLMDRVVVSTDCDKIAGVVNKAYDIEVIKRPAEYATDESPIEESLLHAVEHLAKEENYFADIVVWMQANVPIRKEGTIDKAIKNLCDSDAESCVTCSPSKEVVELLKMVNEEGLIVPIKSNVRGIRWQEFPKRYLLDGSIAALRVDNLYKTRGIREAHIYLGEKVIPIVQEHSMYSLEVDDPDDIGLIEYYLSQCIPSKTRRP
ncbi:MAG TPA: acylneuraminate cytidylyltransferase family protein [Euryarchaeota archaeon]|nr:acylneuraminate cytidylyltransferase family protein [Euryarchaeota archaeon]